MSGTLKDLNKYLFDQLDRLSKATPDTLAVEIDRAKSIEQVGAQVIKAHEVQLNAVELVAKYNGLNKDQATPLLSIGNVEV